MIETNQRRFLADRYMGVWYEIAATRHLFAFGCMGTRARYTPIGGDAFLVENECDTPLGVRRAEAIATATRVPTEFAVKFKYAPISKYKVLAWDSEYEFALVAGRNRDDLWILSRERDLPLTTVLALADYAAEIGYESDKLLLTPV